MTKYIIQTHPGWYVKSGKDDTTNINKAKRFDEKEKAKEFIARHIGAKGTSKILTVNIVSAIPETITIIES